MFVAQRYVIDFLLRKKYTGAQIKKELDEAYGKDAMSKTQMYYWISEIRSGRADLNNIQSPGRPLTEGLDEKILHCLKKEPYASVKRLAEICGHHPQTIRNCLINSMGYKKYNFQWVPHMLTDEMKKRRVSCSKSMLQELRTFQKEGFHHIITGDESWFYLRYFHQFMYTDSKENVPKIPKRMISDTKFMYTIFWNPWKFYIVDVLPKGQKFNSEYFINNILEELQTEVYPDGRRKHSKKYSIHMDNAKPHTSVQTKSWISKSEFVQIEHPPYSPDIAPSDFYLFGNLKTNLKGKEFENEEELLRFISDFLNHISHDELMSVFENWISRLETIIDTQGEYYDK